MTQKKFGHRDIRRFVGVFLLALLGFFLQIENRVWAWQPDDWQPRLQKLLDSVVNDQQTPALAAAIVKDGKLQCNAVSGLRRIVEPDNPVTLEDKFHLGSCTKAMTATLIGILVDEGKLNWDDTIAERLPEIAGDIDEAYQDVTLWQLLTHRAAVMANGSAWHGGGSNTHQNRMEIAGKVLEQKPDALVVGDFSYSNMGYLLAGLFAEVATHESYETLIRNKLFTALKMDSAGFGAPDDNQPAENSWGHTKTGQNLNPVNFDNPPSIAPAGTIHCSIGDWAKFAALHLDMECQQHNLLKPETLTRLHTPYSDDEPKYAGGWLLEQRHDHQWLAHSGSNTFWYSDIHACPEKNIAVLVISNGPMIATQNDVEKISRTVMKWLEEPG